GDAIAIELWFDGAVFVPLNFLDRMTSLAEQFAFGSDVRFGELDYCLPTERDALAQWNHTAIESTAPATVVEWFEQAVALHPDNTAVLHGTTHLSYDQLNRQANQLA